MTEQFLILVNEKDEEIGIAEKMKTHEQGLLHRAFSIFIFSKNGEMLLQRRAIDKYHCGGLWTNACCSHPVPDETVHDAAKRRMKEELGIETDLQKIFDFVYRAVLDKGLTEYEFDHVFAGIYDGEVPYNTLEVMETAFMSIEEIEALLVRSPEVFTPWFRIALPRVTEWWRKQQIT